MPTTYASVFFVAKPSPGKCFIAGITCPACRPWENARASHAVVVELRDQVRPCRYRNEAVEAGTSATGARSTSMPRALRARPVWPPWLRAVVVEARAPICGGESVGGAHGIRL